MYKLEGWLFCSGVSHFAVEVQVCCFLLEDGGGLKLFFVAGVMEGRKEGRDWDSVGVCTRDSRKPTKFALLPRSGSNLVVANLFLAPN